MPLAVDNTPHGIWRYAALYSPHVPAAARLTLGEGGTPAVEVPGLAAAYGLARLVLKREDVNPTGSHKARGVAFQVSALRAARPDLAWLTISSSGNAALAAAAYARGAGVSLAAFVAPATPMATVARLVALGAWVFVAPNALSVAQALAERRGIPNLRPSTDPLAVEGFQSIGWELAETVAPVDALFTFVSSGTSLVGIARAFACAERVTPRPWRPALHAVQGTGAQSIAGEFDARRLPEARSRLGDRGARKTRRVGEAKRWIRATGGSGWVIADAEADAAAAQLAAYGVASSLESGAALAAAGRAAAAGRVESAIVVITGAAEQEDDDFETMDGQVTERLARVDSLEAVEAAIDRLAG